MSAAASVKTASADSPIHEVLAERWSPYAFRDKPVSQDELRSLFEAARWAPSSYNEQPWRYVVATRGDRAQFERLLSCLVEGNQTWAKHVPVLALGIVSLKFAKNGKDNRAAVHDLGLAAGNLVVEATARGPRVHQMIGILPDKAREVFGIPEGYEAWTGIAIGYEGDPATLPDDLKQRDLTPRQRIDAGSAGPEPADNSADPFIAVCAPVRRLRSRFELALTRLRRRKGPEARLSLGLLVSQLCDLWRRETGQPVTANPVRLRSYMGRPESASGCFVCEAVEALQPTAAWIAEHEAVHMRAAIMTRPPGDRVRAVHSAMRGYVAADRGDPSVRRRGRPRRNFVNSAGPVCWYDVTK